MKSFSFFLVVILFLTLVSAQEWNIELSDFEQNREWNIDLTPPTPGVNYSLVNVNNSEFWAGHPYSDLTDDYVPYGTGGSPTATKNLNLGDKNITADWGFFNNISGQSPLQINSEVLVLDQAGNFQDIRANNFIGDGSQLTNISFEGGNVTTNGTISGGEFEGGTYNGSNFTGYNFFGGNFTGDWFFGFLNWSWIQNAPSITGKNTIGFYLYNDSSTIFFNETRLNDTVEDLARVTEHEEIMTITSSGGSVGAISSVAVGFLITRIDVNTTASTKFRFEASELTDGTIIDRDRTLHKGDWRIRKDHAINDSVVVNITAANPDDTFTIKLTYIDNFRP